MAEARRDNKTLPEFNFTFDDSVSEWNIPGPQWIKDKEKTWDGLASGALVFDDQNRVLLVQRASHDSMPDLWEIPGGAVDDEDPSVLYGCARELYEEAGLVARRIKHVIPDGFNGKPGAVFTNRTGKRFYCKFSFEVEVEGYDVQLDPNEHQAFVWASLEEVTSEAIGDCKIPITKPITKKAILESFRIRKQDQEKTGEAGEL